ncbi:gamma-glutamyltransferase 2. Threonine peptidase. MEROPS family T03 [Picrophilus oshimae DSM 9789]|uniref:Gamma-glutamyltransferase 2. Threonine peptidase. MEROPS family T03 n=2 Tax=Picrophilus oshimae TaxID=46632 RepID=A0A8G2FXB0_PICTO|nr:gamma-glutamyltransferase 2. Threonine peptidase. MEROPS family T03 [Picrophilus oshimae DSM 9789]
MYMNYAVASSHPLSTFVGNEILKDGGNAYDAAIATSAALVVVQPHLNGLGGDFFSTIIDNDIYSINGSGNAPELATIEFFHRNGYNKIPEHGPLSSFSIPGLVSSWEILYKNATMKLEKLFSRAISFAMDGFIPSNSILKAIKNFKYGDVDFNNIYYNNGRLLVQRALGRTLKLLAEKGLESFYHGDIARAIEDDMIKKHGLIRFNDLDSYSASVVKPLEIRYRNYSVYTNPPVSQGATALYWLNRLNKYDLYSMPDDLYYSSLINEMYPSYEFRKSMIYDGSSISNDDLLNNYSYSKNKKDEKYSDTTAFSVFDGDAGISAIQSNYMGFGSGHSIHGYGINMNNRGSYFTLDKNHKNALKPGKKTFHTLMSTILNGDKLILLGSMGGDIQPQVNVQIITRIIDLNYNIQDAISYPRFAYPASIYGDADLYSEKGIVSGSKYIDGLSSTMGHAQGILIEDDVHAGFDPRGDGLLKYHL